jgi:hypothetical protein
VKKVKKNSFELLELEMADLERFWRKTPIDPLGVNIASFDGFCIDPIQNDSKRILKVLNFSI